MNFYQRMGILPLKKRVNRDKCSFATKQRMFGVFAIDEILRYRGSRIPGSPTLCHPGNTQKVTKRSMRQCWLRDVGLQINTNTTRSRAWKFLKFVFRCSVLVPNRWMWSSEHIIVGCFWISQHPQLNFLLVEETLPLWQTITPPSTPTNLALLFCRYLS